MATGESTPVAPVPEHLGPVTARLVVRGAAAAVELYRTAFGAEEIGGRFTGSEDEIIHAEMRMGDSVVMLTNETCAEASAKSPASLGGVPTAHVERGRPPRPAGSSSSAAPLLRRHLRHRHLRPRCHRIVVGLSLRSRHGL